MQYTVKRFEYIPHEKTFMTFSGKLATVKNKENGGKYVALIERIDGKGAAAVGWSRANAIRMAYLKCLEMFPTA